MKIDSIDKATNLLKMDSIDLNYTDAASIAAKKASRQSDTHWKLVYLLQNPDSEYEAFCIDRRGNDALFLIPSLDMQATLHNCSDVNLNDAAVLKMSKVDIPEQKVDFSRIR